jgi:esterase/lipase superfamily enzyme
MPPDPQHSFVTASATYLDRPSFIAAVSSSIKKNGNGKVLVFVHGFNNRFDEAVYRFAQVVHDAKSPAVPVLFSWPSQGLVSLAAYKDDRMNATSSGEALDQSLHARAIHAGKIGGKIKNVLLVAPDVSVDVFRSEMQEMGSAKPRFALFLSEDDQALKLSKSIGDGVTRLGNVNPDQEPYNTEFQREGVLVFDLTGLRGGAHSRAFTDVTSVMGMIQQRLAEGQQLTD